MTLNQALAYQDRGPIVMAITAIFHIDHTQVTILKDYSKISWRKSTSLEKGCKIYWWDTTALSW